MRVRLWLIILRLLTVGHGCGSSSRHVILTVRWIYRWWALLWYIIFLFSYCNIFVKCVVLFAAREMVCLYYGRGRSGAAWCACTRITGSRGRWRRARCWSSACTLHTPSNSHLEVSPYTYLEQPPLIGFLIPDLHNRVLAPPLINTFVYECCRDGKRTRYLVAIYNNVRRGKYECRICPTFS